VLTVSGAGYTVGAGLSLDALASRVSFAGTGYTLNTSVALAAGQRLDLAGTWALAAGQSVTATGATLNLGDQSNNSSNAWSNAGSITATNSTTNLGGTFTLAALGTFNRSGGAVNLVGTLDNTGTTLALSPATGSWDLVGGTVKNGTYAASGGAELVFTGSGGTLDGVTAASDLDLTQGPGQAYAFVADGLTLASNATVRLGNAPGTTSGQLDFTNTQTLGGSGTVLFGKSGSNSLRANASGAGATLTVGPGVTVRGSSGSLTNYYGGGAIVNQGTILADDSGGAAGPYAYDRGFSGGNTASTADAIDTGGVTDPAPQAVYQTGRYAGSFSYALGGLTPGAGYTVRLDFAEFAWGSAGQRLFSVALNGTQVLSNFDIFAAAGGKDRAIAESFPATADGGGTITVAFTASRDNALINGIAVLSGGAVVQAVNCGELAGGTITVNPNTFTNQGTLQASNGETVSVSNFQPNAGKMIADVGSTIAITGNFTQAAAGTLTVNVGGTGSGQFGHVTVSQAATLAGTLNVAVVNGFTPSSGNQFTIITDASQSGTFGTLNLPPLDGGLAFHVTYDTKDVMLGVS
jgi:hypothetical protein